MRVLYVAAALVAAGLGRPEGATAQSVLSGTGNVVATTRIAPFAITGYIEALRLEPQAGADLPHAGGKITVNGKEIVIPDNTVITMPGAQLTMYDLVNLKPGSAGVNADEGPYHWTGLGLDRPLPRKAREPFEATIVGNIVGGRYIAGLVNVAPEFLNTHQGYVTSIDYRTGDLCINGVKERNEARRGIAGCLPWETRLKLNDPQGRFGMVRGGQDRRFTVDDTNPTVRATTGYPMCVPRADPAVADDPRCPKRNRPIDLATGLPLTRFVMDGVPLAPVVPGAAPALGATLIPPCPDCDSRQQMPVMVGDYVTFSGMVMDEEEERYVSVSQLVATVGAYTRPCGLLGTNPLADPTGALANNGIATARCNPLKDMTYIEWETAEVGTAGTTVDGGLIEGQDRIRIVGMTTDPTAQIEVYAITSNPGRPSRKGIRDPLQDGHLRWIANVVPERFPFGRFELFVQRDIQRFPLALPSGAVLPITGNHLGTDYGAPRQFFVHVAGAPALIPAIPGGNGTGAVAAATPALHGRAVPTAADLVDARGHHLVFANGLVPGQYFQPIQTYVMPATAQIGDPLTPGNFECMDFLVYGSTLATPSFPDGITMGQLNPWPGGLPSGVGRNDGALPPSQVRCSSLVPIREPPPGFP